MKLMKLLAGCGPLRGPINPLETNPLTGLASLGPLKNILISSKNIFFSNLNIFWALWGMLEYFSIGPINPLKTNP